MTDSEYTPMPVSGQPQNEQNGRRFLYLTDECRLTGAPLDGYVYVLKAGPYYKIGRAKRLEPRLMALDVQLPWPCELIHTIVSDDHLSAEKNMHRRYDHCRQNGEWFLLCPDEVMDVMRVGAFVCGNEIKRGNIL